MEMVTTRITEAFPITSPSAVKKLRTLLAFSACRLNRRDSPKYIEFRGQEPESRRRSMKYHRPVSSIAYLSLLAPEFWLLDSAPQSAFRPLPSASRLLLSAFWLLDSGSSPNRFAIEYRDRKSTRLNSS